MKRRFVITPAARDDLRAIFLDLAADNPEAAERLRSDFYDALQSLGRSPGIGHYHDESLNRTYRFWNFRAYVVVYAWESKPIQIISVIHGARDLATILADRPIT